MLRTSQSHATENQECDKNRQSGNKKSPETQSSSRLTCDSGISRVAINSHADSWVGLEKVNLCFALLNVQGLVTKRTNKLQTQELRDIFNSYDIFLLTETWTDNSSEVAVSNFGVFILTRVEKKQKSKRNSGGVILYLRNYFVNANTHVYTSKDDILWKKNEKSKLALENDLYIFAFVM